MQPIRVYNSRKKQGFPKLDTGSFRFMRQMQAQKFVLHAAEIATTVQPAPISRPDSTLPPLTAPSKHPLPFITHRYASRISHSSWRWRQHSLSRRWSLLARTEGTSKKSERRKELLSVTNNTIQYLGMPIFPMHFMGCIFPWNSVIKICFLADTGGIKFEQR